MRKQSSTSIQDIPPQRSHPHVSLLLTIHVSQLQIWHHADPPTPTRIHQVILHAAAIEVHEAQLKQKMLSLMLSSKLIK